MSEPFHFIPPESVLDLSIKGSVGTFAVDTEGGGANQIRVQYIETHVGFAIHGDAEERLLQHLAPVREVFNVSELQFDELMQRDIDDARVSTSLIDYLLTDSGDALVKFFPPIIVVVLPTDAQGHPADVYPEVQQLLEEDAKQPQLKWKLTRSGAVGNEAFEFKQMVPPNGEPDPHNYAQLRLNTTRCRLAIVDGQHRAMALLALYRNYKDWPANTLQYKDYYKRWSRSTIERHDLSAVQLPVVLCTFPDLHAQNPQRGMKVAEACRSVFLALNKNARPVTRARNYLLDDRDLIAHMLRKLLGHVKRQDATSSLAIRLWNIELDGEENRRALSAPMALTGVMHLYGAIEFLMLNEKWDGKLRLPRQNLWKKKELKDCIRRLDAKSLLGAERTAQANRQLIERETAEILCDLFWDRYGKYIVQMLDRLWPYRAHNDCALSLEAKLRAQPYGSTYHSILFEGQGIGRVFSNYVEWLREQRSEWADSDSDIPPELQASFEEFEEKQKERDNIVDKFCLDRTRRFFDCLTDSRASAVNSVVKELYRTTFTTEAFQYALIITFFSAIEHCRDEAERNNSTFHESVVAQSFDEYITQLNHFLKAEGTKGAWDIIRVFYGEVHGGYSGTEVEVVRSSSCMKKILVPGELKPDEWTKFRYLLLELWSPSDPMLQQHIDQQRRHLRLTVVRMYQNRELEAEASKTGKLVGDLSEAARKRIVKSSTEVFCKALRPLGVDLPPEGLDDVEMQAEASTEQADTDDGEDAEDG